jgi:hypothetical protein
MRASNKVQTATIEVDDICEFDSLPQTAVAADDTVEIELTAEQMDALLSPK